MDPITSAALTDSYKSTVKSKNMLILNSPKIQSNLNDFKQQDITHPLLCN